MANPIPFPLPDRPDEFQLDRQWAENYIPAFKYGARLDSSQVVGGNITVEDTGIPVGVFDTLDFVGATITDNGDGSVTIEVTADVSNVDWTTTNWTNFFNDIDWSQNTDWDSFVTSVITNWTATNWDNFIDTFITNVDSDDVFNFLNQISGSTKGDILVYDGATWTSLPAGADGLFLQANSVTATGLAYAAGGGGAPLTIQEEGVNVETATTQINFIGAGVTASSAGVGLVDVTIPGGGGSADAVILSVNQTAHGFVVGDWVRVDAANTYTKAQANSSANADVVGVVTTVVGVDDFEITTEGLATGAWVPSYGANMAVHLSTATAGGTQATAPTTVGTIDKPLGIVIADASSMYVHNYRGRQITNATSGAIVTVPQQMFSGFAAVAQQPSGGTKGDTTKMYVVVAQSGNDTIEKLEKDSLTGIYTQPNVSGLSVPFIWTLAFDASNVYVFNNTSPYSVTRYDLDLGSATTMSVVGAPAVGRYIGSFVNGTQIYAAQDTSGGGALGVIDIFDISGTTLTYNSSLTLTGSPVGTSVYSTMNLVNGEIWMQNSSDLGLIKKFNLSTGAFIQEDRYYPNRTIVGFGYLGAAQTFELIVSDAIEQLEVNTYTI